MYYYYKYCNKYIIYYNLYINKINKLITIKMLLLLNILVPFFNIKNSKNSIKNV